MVDSTSFSRRDFIKTLGVGAVIALFPIACSFKEPEVAEKLTVADDIFGTEQIFTENDPGAWGGFEDTHIPETILTKLDNAGMYRVDVTVHHVMTPEHWIEHIWLRNGYHEIIAEKPLQPSDPYPAYASFVVDIHDIEKFVVYERCNLHGLWMAEYAVPTV